MRRIWFKKQMAEAIIEGRKTSTTRDHPLKLEQYQAVRGSRYNAKVFSKIEIQDRFPTYWEYVAELFFKEEGFGSQEEMLEYLRKEKLVKKSDDFVYFHRFKVVELLAQ